MGIHKINLSTGGGTLDGTGTANRIPYWMDIDTLAASPNLFHDNGLGIGKSGTQRFSLSYSDPNPGTTDPSVLLTTPVSGIINLCFEADKAFDWKVPALPNPLLIFHSKTQARNLYAFMGIGETGGVPDKFFFAGGGGDDIDGTPQESDGFDVYVSSGPGGTGGAGGRGGHIVVQTLGPSVGNHNGGDFLFDLALGFGTGRQGVISTLNANEDLRFKNNGSGVFRIEDSGSTAAMTFDHDGTDAIYSCTTGTHKFFQSITLDTGKGLATSKSAGNTALLQAYDVDGAAYTTFLTLTANNTPTCDLSTAVTIGGNPIGTVTDISGSVTLDGTDGWASASVLQVWSFRVGKLVTLRFRIRGVGAGTGAKMYIPYTIDASDESANPIITTDTLAKDIGYVSAPASGNEIRFYKDASNSAWTDAVTREVQGEITFSIS